MLLDYRLFSAGYCSHPECITIKGGRWRSQQYPAICALIHHPKQGNILFDTGYNPRFFAATQKWPLWLYRKIAPVQITEEKTLIHQLKEKGIKPNEISHIVLSHFHADHIAGIKDFPQAKIIYSRAGFDAVKESKGFAALKKGFLGGLIPEDFASRSVYIENKKSLCLDTSMHPFTEGVDIFADGSIIAISLPGHAKGQYGLLFKDANQDQVFLVADSCWSSRAYREYALPAAMTNLIHDNCSEYQETLEKLHRLYKKNASIRIIPSHCQEVWQQLLEADYA